MIHVTHNNKCRGCPEHYEHVLQTNQLNRNANNVSRYNHIKSRYLFTLNNLHNNKVLNKHIEYYNDIVIPAAKMKGSLRFNNNLMKSPYTCLNIFQYALMDDYIEI